MKIIRRGGIGFITATFILSLVAASGTAYSAQPIASPSDTEVGKPGLQPESPQEQKEKQQRLEQQNLQEQQRLQNPSLKERGEPPTYKEEPPIGGKTGAGEFPEPAFPIVKGELIKIEGEMYTIRDAEGKEVQVRVDRETKMGRSSFTVGDRVKVMRTLKGYALWMNPIPAKMETVTGPSLGSPLAPKQAVWGEILKVEGNNYVIKDRDGHEVALIINQNTRMLCPQAESLSSLLPAPSASDKPEAKGQPQDLARTAEQPGTDVGPGTKPSAGATSECKFKAGDKIEAEISDMGVATFIKTAGRPQPGQPLP